MKKILDKETLIIDKKFFFTIIIVVYCILSIYNVNYAKYVLTRNFSTNIQSTPFYFTATADEKNFNIPAGSSEITLGILIKNNDGVNFNKYNTNYNVSIDNSKFSLKVQDTNDGTITGGSIKENNVTITLTKNSNVIDHTRENLNIIIKTSYPYVKQINIPITITIDAFYKVKKEVGAEYALTLQEAYDATISGGGDLKGGTITVLKDVTDTQSVARTDQETNRSIIVNKSITIDTNGVKLTVSAPINLDSGTLQIKGEGEIYCPEDSATIKCYGGTLETEGKPRIICKGVGIQVREDAKVNLKGGYVIGEGRSGLQTWGSGDIIIDGAYIIGIPRTKNGITVNKDATCAITIKGNSVIANGIKDDYGIGGTATTGRGSCISFQGTAKPLTITDNAIVTSGLYSAEGIALYNGAVVNITGNASVYSCMYSVAHAAFICNGNAESVTVNTTGIIGSNTNVITSKKSTNFIKNFTITKGKFVTTTNNSSDIFNAQNVNKPSSFITSGNRNVTYKYLNTSYVLTDVNMSNYYYLEY